MKEKIMKWYHEGLWTVEMVRMAVEKGVLIEEEMKEILGEKEE